MGKVIVIGGGPSGCTAAYTLKKLGHEVLLIEAANHIGGRTRTQQQDGYTIATGAIFLMSIYHRTHALIRELGQQHTLVPWKAATAMAEGTERYRIRYDKPLTNLGLKTLGWADKWRLLRESVALLLRPGIVAFDGDYLAAVDTGENLETWTRRKLGDKAYEYIVKPNMETLYAVPPSELSISFQLAAMQSAINFSLSVPQGGMGMICDWLASGLEVRTGLRVDSIEKCGKGMRVLCGAEFLDADAVVVATDARVAAGLLTTLASANAVSTLKQSPYTEYAHVVLGYADDPWPETLADMTVPVGPGTRAVNAILLHGRRSPTSVPKGAQVVGVYFNGAPLKHMDDTALLREAHKAIAEYLGADPATCFEQVFRFEHGLTIPVPGHYANMAAVRLGLPARVQLAGDYFAQAGVEAAVIAGERAAQAINDQLQSCAPALALSR